MKLIHHGHHLFGATLLIAGTCIGVGMLALPVATANAGFFASLPAYFIAWLFMLSTSRLIVEACLWCPNDSNLITISRTLLGPYGAAVVWFLYLFLFYCLMVAHTVAGGGAVAGLQGGTWPQWLTALIYVGAFAPAVYLGTRWVDRLNIVLMTGVILTFLFFIINAMPHVQMDLLARGDYSKTWKALPVLFTSFGFQNLIPTLVTYTNRNDKLIMKAIWIGTSIPLVLYILWQMLIHGIIPLDSLQHALAMGQNAVVPLQETLMNSGISKVGEAFAFFAMTTSFVGIAIAFFDFWADGLKWKKKGIKKLALVALVFLIPYIVSCIDPTIFFMALTWAGGVGVAILLGVIPILFVWSGRYIQKRTKVHEEIKGGKVTLFILFAFSLFVLFQMINF